MSTPTPRTCGELSCDECNARTAALTAELKELSQAYELNRVSIDELDADRARAERAEAEIIRLRTENSDLKATDTRPLLTGKLTHAGLCRIGGEQVDGVFISIDREQIKALRRLPMYQRIELRVAAMKEGEK